MMPASICGRTMRGEGDPQARHRPARQAGASSSRHRRRAGAMVVSPEAEPVLRLGMRGDIIKTMRRAFAIPRDVRREAGQAEKSQT